MTGIAVSGHVTAQHKAGIKYNLYNYITNLHRMDASHSTPLVDGMQIGNGILQAYRLTATVITRLALHPGTVQHNDNVMMCDKFQLDA